MVERVATDDAALVAQAASGSEQAFRTLYRAYARPVYWLAHGLLGNPAAPAVRYVDERTRVVPLLSGNKLELRAERVEAVLAGHSARFITAADLILDLTAQDTARGLHRR